jgi:regulatory protein
MPDPTVLRDLADARDHIVRSHARGLVDNQNAIHASHSILCDPPCPLWLNLSPQRIERYIETRERRFKKSEEATEPRDPAKARERVFQRAGKLLAAKQRSVEELRERLLEGRGANETIVTEVIERLREYGYLDDARYAHSYAQLRVQQRPIGRQRLERDLRMKQIDKTTVDAALDSVFAEKPEAELIDRAIEKRSRLRGRPQTRADAKKLFDHLLRQGFAFDLVREKIRAVSKDDVEA